MSGRPNKGMKLTKLSAAWLPEWTCRLMPAPARSDAGTASQLIPGVRQTIEVRDKEDPPADAGLRNQRLNASAAPLGG
jgi:hypothetical protein